MAHLIVAMYADRGGAEGALQALLTAGLARDRIGLVGAEHRPGTELAPARGRPGDETVAKLQALPLPPDDVRSFASGVAAGHVLLTARVEDGNVDRALEVVNLFDPVDLDRDTLARGGAAGPGAGSGSGGLTGADVGGPLGAGLSAGAMGGASNTAALPGMASMSGAADDTGTADLRTGETSLADMGSSATATGDRRAEDRAGAPGAMELAGGGVFRRDPSRGSSRVRVYARQG